MGYKYFSMYKDYEPFGKVSISIERTKNNFRFPGQYFIEETGLYYNWWRWYSNNAGRYIQKEFNLFYYFSNWFELSTSGYLIELKKEIFRLIEDIWNISWGYYIYSVNNPINFCDYDGEKVKDKRIPEPPKFPPKTPKKPSCIVLKKCWCVGKCLKCCGMFCKYEGGPDIALGGGVECYFVKNCK